MIGKQYTFFRMNIVVVIVFISLIFAPHTNEATANLPAHIPTATETVLKKSFCVGDRVYRKISYDCSQMDLREVPQNIKSSVEIFELSINRIRELFKTSFKRYPNIVFLYLSDNNIQYIEEGTFSHLTDLEAVDLSINALSTISLELFKLPRLRNLYYSNNSLLYVNDGLKRLEKPVIAPLQKLAFASCRLSSVPDLGILPDLVMLNVSFNPLDQITPQQLSQYCSLKIVAVESPTEMSPCMCQTLRSYFERRAIQLKDWYDCPTIHEESVYCTGSINVTDSADYDVCMMSVTEKRSNEKTKETWFWIMCSLGAFFIAFICLLYYFHRRNVKKADMMEKKSIKLQHIHQTSNGNVEVLLTK